MENETCCTPVAEGLNEAEAVEMAQLLKVLADPARLRIISMLMNAGEVCACDITEPLGLSQPTVSHHLKVLRQAGFVSAEKRSKWVYFHLESDRVEEVRRALAVQEPVAALQ